MKIPDAAIEPLGVLGVLILTSLMDVIVVNFFTESTSPRQHNKLKLVNECLARQQLAYPIWYITLAAVLVDSHSLNSHEATIVRVWMQLAAIASVLFWLGGLNGVAGQDRAIAAHHKCEPNTHCAIHSLWLWVVVLILNASLTAVSITLALTFIVRPEVVKALTK